MRDFLLAVAVIATIASISTAVDEECIQRKIRGLPVHWPNPSDCAGFYRCTNKNIKRELLCPKGKIYNPKTGRCASQERSRCRLSLAAPLSKAVNNTCGGQLSGTFMSDSNRCRGFYICNSNFSYPQTCDLGTYFNPEILACEPDEKTLCWENLCVNKTNSVYMADEEDCHSFYICYEKIPVPQKCRKGSYFNTKSLSCQPGECPSDETTTTTDAATTDTATTDATTTDTTTAGGTTTDATTTVATTTDTTTTDATTTHATATDATTTNATTSDNTTTNATTTDAITTDATTTDTTSTYATTTDATTTDATTTDATTTRVTSTAAETTTPSCTGTTTISTCTPETTTTTCVTTTCNTKTTTTTCSPATTTTTCTPQTTTTTCASETETTTTCTPATTTTTCTPQTTATTCAAKTTTTTCSPEETTTSANGDCSNSKCDNFKCRNTENGFVFPAQNDTGGFCVCLHQKAEYRQCPDEAIFNESLLICVAQDKVCPSSKCFKKPDYTTFPAAYTTTGFCRCLYGQASFVECVGTNYVYNNTLGVCIKSTDCEEKPSPIKNLCKGGYREGDFVHNPNNCILLYICYEGELVEASCETGNYFDDTIKACLPDTERKCPYSYQPQAYFNNGRHKRSVRAPNCVEGSKTQAADCDKYYKCSTGHRLLYGCGKDSFFNLTTSACQLDVENVCWPINSCTEGEKNSLPENNTKYYECVYGKIEVKSCGLDSYFNKLEKACVVKQECTCPGGYSDGQMSAHPTDCDKYYICTNSEQILQICATGNYFDKKILKCRNDVANTCHVKEPCLCPGGYKEGDLSAHPTNCHQHYICINGQQILQNCEKGNYFDNRTLECEADIYNECWPTADCTCPGGYQEGELSAHPKECSKYYICRNSRQVLEDCGTNNRFNNNTLSCDLDVHHVCRPNLCAGHPNGALVANPQQCNAFFLCSNNEATAKACNEGQWFDPSESACVADVKAVCYNPCADESAGAVVLLPHPICNEYYFCNDRKTFVGTCQVGSFDIETGICNESKKCYPNPCNNPEVVVFPDAYDPMKFYWCNKNKQPIPYYCPTGMEFDEKFKICKKMSDPDCPVCTKDGAFPTLNDTSDTKFCVCVDRLSTKIECPNEYVFSKELGVCYSNAPCDPSFCLAAPEYAIAQNRNCSTSFCMCVDKHPVIINCPNNGNFNPYTLECSNYTISSECLQATCIGETNNNHIFKPIDQKNNNGFCQCINQIATFKPCNYGSTFNPDLLICQLAEINCNSYQCRGLADKTIIPSVSTTEGYCECVGGVATYHNCANNGEFNVTSNKCEAPPCDLSKCTDTSVNTPLPASVPNGFCMCNIGFVECPTDGTLFSETFRNCIKPCPQMLCEDKPDKYLVSSLINNNSFCVCHVTPNVGATYEVCPSGSFVFDEAEQMCVGNAEELCGTDFCKNLGPFEAKGTLTGFCLCTEGSSKPKFQQCLEGIFVPDKKACLPRAEDVCDIYLCSQATIDHPITLPANNSILEFCYCSSPSDAMLLPCPNGKYYNQAKGMCTSELEDNCSCPNNVAKGDKVPDSTSCNKYHECVDGVMESRTCPNGNYFDVEVNCCIPDTEGVCVKTSQCTCLGIYYQNERLPHPVNRQMYYTCQGNSLHEYKCPIGRIYSAAQKQCISNANLRQKRSVDLSSDHEFGCLENEKRSVPTNCSQYEICLQRIWKRKTCSNYRYYNPEQRKCLEPRDDFVCSYAKITTLPICNVSMEYYLLKAKSCQHYYRCEAGKWRLYSCGRQKYYNKKISSCLPIPDDPLFKCELLGNNTNEEVVRDKEFTSCQHLSQRFYGKNCAMYLICLDNDWWYQYCPPDMYYNHSLSYCIRDIHMQCKDVMQINVSLNNEEYSQDSCQQDGLLRPSAMACNRYFVCVNGKWQMQHCSLHEFYDATQAKCSLDTKGICAQLKKNCLPNERKPVPRNCSMYEECSNEGKWLKKTCPQDKIFEDLLHQCTTNQGVCSRHGLKRTCRQSETMTVKENCSKFYYCSQDTWSLGNCLNGFMYSAAKKMCVAHMPQDSCNPVVLNESQGTEVTFSQESNPCQGKIDGYSLAHPLQCSHYYICLRQSLYLELQCPRGSYFDSNMGYCRPNNGNCRLPLTGECANASDEALVPHHSDCQAYYSCSSINGTELLHCSKGQYFDKHTRQCRIDHGECKKEIIPIKKCAGLSHGTRLAHDIYCNIYYACVKDLAIPVECPHNDQFNSTLSKCVSNKEHQCQHGFVERNITYSCGNLSDGTYFPDLKDCTRYYICSQGQVLPKKCANISYFDNEQLLCMPDDGSCPFVNKDEGKHNLAPPDPSVCEGKHGYLLQDPLNCNNFYACVHSKLKHERCYSHQFFNTTSQQCQQQLLYESHLNGNTNLLTDSNIKARKITIPQCLDETTSLKKLCSEMSKVTSFAEPEDCRRYITCQDAKEEPISERCRNGESFDSLLRLCRQNDGTCLLENGQRVGECSDKHGQLARDPKNCRNYFVCINGQKIHQTCENDEYFSKTQNMCIKDTQQVCKQTHTNEVYTQSCVGLSESVLYPYIHDNCRSYFQCIKGVPKIHVCADDLYFDPLAIKCIKNKTECIMPTATLQRSPALRQTFNKLCSNKKLEYPYANVDNDCRSFYLCHANGDISHELCPLGTIFNEELINCTAKNKTDCARS